MKGDGLFKVREKLIILSKISLYRWLDRLSPFFVDITHRCRQPEYFFPLQVTLHT